MNEDGTAKLPVLWYVLLLPIFIYIIHALCTFVVAIIEFYIN